MNVRRIMLIAGLMTTMTLGLAGPGDATTTQPKTLAGAVAAAHKVYRSVSAESTAAQARHGIVDLGVGSGSGCREIWGYTGAVWHDLGQCNQDFFPYPTALPGKLTICKGNQYTLVRTGPGPQYPVRAKLTRNTTVSVTDFKLTLPATSKLDGVGYYRIILGGRVAWVASYRVTKLSEGCSGWNVYWTLEAKHR
jgi:hypothetical protein